jgi:hypothetical protein
MTKPCVNHFLQRTPQCFTAQYLLLFDNVKSLRTRSGQSSGIQIRGVTNVIFLSLSFSRLHEHGADIRAHGNASPIGCLRKEWYLSVELDRDIQTLAILNPPDTMMIHSNKHDMAISRHMLIPVLPYAKLNKYAQVPQLEWIWDQVWCLSRSGTWGIVTSTTILFTPFMTKHLDTQRSFGGFARSSWLGFPKRTTILWGDWDHSNWSSRGVNADCWTICINVGHSMVYLSTSFDCLFPSRAFTRFHCQPSLLDTLSHDERPKAQSSQRFKNTRRDHSSAAASLGKLQGPIDTLRNSIKILRKNGLIFGNCLEIGQRDLRSQPRRVPERSYER